MHPPFNYDSLNFSKKFGIMMDFPNFCPWNTIASLISPPLIVLLDWARAGGGFTERAFTVLGTLPS